MSSTYLSLHYHVVFSTKHRQHFIADDWRTELFRYLGGTINHLGGSVAIVGGIVDHVHVLMGLKSIHVLADFIREIKKSSSRWIHQHLGIEHFAWQDGYAAFTVSPTACNAVNEYIANQDEHHRQRTFQEELILMLKKSGIKYDPNYLD